MASEQKTGTEITKKLSISEATQEIERVLTACDSATLAQMPALKKAVTLARGIYDLRLALSEEIVETVFMHLQGTPLGFITDKDKDGGYPVAVVRECLIEAMLKGLQPINNEFNIISGRCYGARNGLERLVKDWPGLTDLRWTPGVPQMAGEKGALVSMRATWKLGGRDMELYRGQTKRKNEKGEEEVEDTRIAVKVNSGMGPDAIIGKAERKMFKAIYSILTGGKVSIEDGEAIDTVGEVVNSKPTPAPAEPSQDGKRIKIGGNKGAPPERKSEPAPESTPAREPGEGE